MRVQILDNEQCLVVKGNGDTVSGTFDSFVDAQRWIKDYEHRTDPPLDEDTGEERSTERERLRG